MISIFESNDGSHSELVLLERYFGYHYANLTLIVKNVIFLLLLCSITSCYYNRGIVYLQDKRVSTQPQLIPAKKVVYRVQPNDILSIKVKSATDAQISEIFNITSWQNAMFVAPGGLYLEGYTINDAGQITLPVLGTMTVTGLTVTEIQQLIQTSAQKYLNNATVIVKLISFKISVLGEVRNPGYHYVYNNQATILEGLALAGDLNQVGNRRNIKLIRQSGTGTQVAVIDLTNAQLLQSEFFYLMPNDVLYVAPMRANTRRSNLEVLGVTFSALTTAILILSYIDSNN